MTIATGHNQRFLKIAKMSTKLFDTLDLLNLCGPLPLDEIHKRTLNTAGSDAAQRRLYDYERKGLVSSSWTETNDPRCSSTTGHGARDNGERVRHRDSIRIFAITPEGVAQYEAALESLGTGAETRWAREYDQCSECGSAEKKHAGHGVCVNCRSRERARKRVGS